MVNYIDWKDLTEEKYYMLWQEIRALKFMIERDETLIKNTLQCLFHNKDASDYYDYNLFEKIDKLTKNVEELKQFVIEKRKSAVISEKMKISKKVRDYIYSTREHKCCMCNKTFDRKYLHIDHIIPLSKGGTNEEKNLQILCAMCNIKKSNLIINNVSGEEKNAN